ncbi:MAG: hypothetical protein ACOVRM_18980 [Planctomycetaceae bacterium]
MSQVVPPSFLFQYTLPMVRADQLPGSASASLRLPSAVTVFLPAQLNSAETPWTLKAAWNTEGLGFEIRLRKKSFPPAGRWSAVQSSDRVMILLDTRPAVGLQRATEFCSLLTVLPLDDDADDQPSARFIEIAQQRTTRVAQDPRRCRLETVLVSDGYTLSVWIPGSQLPGFSELAETRALGLYVIVEDSELGQLPMSIGGDFPIAWNPSLWTRMELV